MRFTFHSPVSKHGHVILVTATSTASKTEVIEVHVGRRLVLEARDVYELRLMLAGAALRHERRHVDVRTLPQNVQHCKSCDQCTRYVAQRRLPVRGAGNNGFKNESMLYFVQS